MVDAKAGMSERLIGFPTTWAPSSPLPDGFTQVWPADPLRAILGVTGFSIHSIVSSRRVKMVVLQLFKAWCEVMRHEAEKREAAYQAWLSWVRYLVPVEEWG